MRVGYAIVCNALMGMQKKGNVSMASLMEKDLRRTNVIGAWSRKNKLFATQTYEHTINKTTFVTWLKDNLIKHLKKGIVVIMDNAPWHKGNDLKDLIESTGAKLIKLPPYSPDLNPIEHAWANLKHYVKSAKKDFDNFSDNLATQLLKMNHSKIS